MTRRNGPTGRFGEFHRSDLRTEPVSGVRWLSWRARNLATAADCRAAPRPENRQSRQRTVLKLDGAPGLSGCLRTVGELKLIESRSVAHCLSDRRRAIVFAPEARRAVIHCCEGGLVKNLDRLKKANVRSLDAKKPPAELSLEGLRQVTGGGFAYAHVTAAGSCVPFN
jgi:hypothetical protein